MNDLVVDYQLKIATNAGNNIVDVIPRFYVHAVGANLQNGFGLQFDDILPGVIQNVTGYNHQHSYITLSGNGTEANQTKAVVIAFDNTENVIHRPGGGFYNTLDNGRYGISDTLTITIHFTTPQNPADVGTPPYNPFLIKNIDIPQQFDYTWEMVEVISGHLKFVLWAETGDQIYQNWYQGLAGYRDDIQIYQQ